ncbi:MAG: RNA polymerase sigma factor, partial [Bryobacteraceae bacterium]
MKDAPARHGPSFLQMRELIRKCAAQDEASWQELVHQIHQSIAAIILRTCRRYRETSTSVVEDLVQETCLHLCANRYRALREFRGETLDEFYGLLRKIATNATMDHFRTSLAAKRGGGQPEYPIDPYVESMAAGVERLPAMERRILIEEIDQYLLSMDVRPVDRRIFWLYYRNGMTSRAIAAVPGIGLTQKGVE